MIYLFLHVVLLSGFGIFLKDAENRGHRLDPIGLVNYATAVGFSCALAYRANSFTFTPFTLIFGLANGISYAFGFFVPYLDRLVVRSETPAVSKIPLII